jgi:hypothetical protein
MTYIVVHWVCREFSKLSHHYFSIDFSLKVWKQLSIYGGKTLGQDIINYNWSLCEGEADIVLDDLGEI